MINSRQVERLSLLLFAAFCLSAVASELVEGAEAVGATFFYASQSGKPTLDQGEGGGNPFASALVELLERPSLTTEELREELVSLTRAKSSDFQTPEVKGGGVTLGQMDVTHKESQDGSRVAFVFVYSDYSSSSASSLPGAKRDLARVADALRDAGFSVQTGIDLPKDRLEEKLKAFSEMSQSAELALVYMTGHGYERHGQVYLTPSDFPFRGDPEDLAAFAIDVSRVAEFTKARKANLVFFGGCRSFY